MIPGFPRFFCAPTNLHWTCKRPLWREKRPSSLGLIIGWNTLKSRHRGYFYPHAEYAGTVVGVDTSRPCGIIGATEGMFAMAQRKPLEELTLMDDYMFYAVMKRPDLLQKL